jgi:hypothetical protein
MHPGSLSALATESYTAVRPTLSNGISTGTLSGIAYTSLAYRYGRQTTRKPMGSIFGSFKPTPSRPTHSFYPRASFGLTAKTI